MKIRLAENENEIAECLSLRREVFVSEQNVPEELELDGNDNICLHILATDNRHTIAAARLMKLENYFKIQRVCVARSARSTGIGAALMRFIIEYARNTDDIKTLKLSSQKGAVIFYEKLGFEPYGNEYLDAGIPHLDMQLSLS